MADRAPDSPGCNDVTPSELVPIYRHCPVRKPPGAVEEPGVVAPMPDPSLFPAAETTTMFLVVAADWGTTGSYSKRYTYAPLGMDTSSNVTTLPMILKKGMLW